MIKILPEEVINKIAAGEVIERPASVVKELIENSVDAGAKEIKIEIRKSGKELIRVTDDGCGISVDNLELALERYATSKIRDFNDIFNLRTLGFRGEALPSIASVSCISITSKPKEQKNGWIITSEGGKILSKSECACKDGTTVEVRKLFFNTPVRKKFLKDEYIERLQIEKIIEEYALCYPEISFKFISDEKEILNFIPVRDVKERNYDTLGKDIFDTLIEFSTSDNVIESHGFISKPGFELQYNRFQFFFINRRPVANRVLTQAIYNSYRDIIQKGRHPCVVLYFTISNELIDVNCHPTKRLVRFSNDQLIHDFIVNAIKLVISRPVEYRVTDIFLKAEGVKKDEPTFRLLPTTLPRSGEQEYLDMGFKSEDRAEVESCVIPKNITPIGSLFNTYLIYQTEKGILILDQHAACERILYERMLNFDKDESVEVLLIPFIFSLTQSQANSLRENLQMINSLGFEIQEFGGNSFIFRSYPKVYGNIKNAQEFINSFLLSLSDEIERSRSLQLQKEDIAKVACRAAVKASDFVSNFEMTELINQLRECKEPFRCPHGRPISIEISIDELNRKFNR